MVYYLRFILVFVILLPFTLAASYLDNSVNPAVVILAALSALLIDFIVDSVGRRINEPKVKVDVNTVNDETSISFVTSRPLEMLATDFPVLGKIKNIHDNNSVADGKTAIKQFVGSNTQVSQNNIELYVENIQPNSKLQFKILFEPATQSFSISGTDRYKISYSWHSGGEQRTMTKWLSIESGEEVEPPNGIVKGATLYKRSLSPDEIKKHYEEGLNKHGTDGS